MMHHLQDIMADTDLYCWEPIQAFYAVWCQQLEQGHVIWAAEEVNLKYRRGLMWQHPAMGPSPFS